MSKVVQFNKGPKKAPKISANISTGGYSFEAEVDVNIEKLCEATGLDRDEAIKLATDFYRSYPMLMEWVRSPENLLRR